MNLNGRDSEADGRENCIQHLGRAVQHSWPVQHAVTSVMKRKQYRRQRNPPLPPPAWLLDNARRLLRVQHRTGG